jgi:hypothetical protein
MSIDDIFDEWPKESLSPIHPKKRIMTEHQFDFSTEGFPHSTEELGEQTWFVNTIREKSRQAHIKVTTKIVMTLRIH